MKKKDRTLLEESMQRAELTIRAAPLLPTTRVDFLIPGEARLSNDEEVIEWHECRRPQPGDREQARCLEAFIAIADTRKPEQVLALAQKYGMLGICEHGLHQRFLCMTCWE